MKLFDRTRKNMKTNKFQRGFKRGVALLLASALMLSGCGAGTGNGSGAAANDASGKNEIKELDVILDWYPNALHAFLYVAMEKGYFEHEGLKINIQFPSNSSDAISLVAAGQSDIGLYYQQDVIQARANQNIPVKSIGAVVQKPLNIFLSLKEKNINSPTDLVGKTVGYAGTELTEALIRSVIEYVGADYSDVKMIDVGFDLMSSMTTGNVDATIGCFLNHEVPQMEEEGFEVSWFNLDDYGVPTYYEGVFLANDKTIETESETLKAFLRACEKGFEDMKSNPEEALKILLENQSTDNFPLSESVERRSMEMLIPLMENENADFLSQSDSYWQENIEWMLNQGLIEKPVDPDQVRVNLEYR